MKKTLLALSLLTTIAHAQVTIGLDQPRTDSDFWTAFADYVPEKAKALEVKVLKTSSENDAQKMIANAEQMLQANVNAIVLAPQDTASATGILKTAEEKRVPVITVDTRPDSGKVYMVVRPDNKAYGKNSCIVLGEKLGGQGTVVEFQGALSSINGRDRSEGFAECMKTKYPNIKVVEVVTDWQAEPAIEGLKSALAAGEVNGIYMQAGGVYLEPTLNFLHQHGKLIPAGQAGHIVIVSNDGIKAELDAIAKGEIDATISQPADMYAHWALFYAKAAAEGQRFSVGPTDHNSNILQPRSGLMEDQISAPVVTVDGVKFPGLRTYKYNDKALWGNR